MPMYEYRCQSCGRAFERLCRMSDVDTDLTCPACASTLVERLLPRLQPEVAHCGATREALLDGDSPGRSAALCYVIRPDPER
jgi:putative FmdB family regulatory protein